MARIPRHAIDVALANGAQEDHLCVVPGRQRPPCAALYWVRARPSSDFDLYVSLTALHGDRREDEPPDLLQLKRAMADAHPDRGGTSKAFIATRRAYEEARKRSARRAAEGGEP
jgi:hypothetical protein